MLPFKPEPENENLEVAWSDLFLSKATFLTWGYNFSCMHSYFVKLQRNHSEIPLICEKRFFKRDS